MKICVFGSSSSKTPKEYTDVGYELGLRIAEEGHSLVFGGGKDGMMGAVASGVYDKGGHITTIAPKWIDDFDVEFENYDNYIKTDTINERKDLFLEQSDLFIVCPGGLGTLDELFDFLALRYLKRHSKKIILFSINHFYEFLFSMLQKMYYEGLLSEDTPEMFDIVTSIDEIFELI